ncbi:hypothetical protein J6590_006794 [Homalodisca vitripennis]|nr:hypothetical protein J6590_006794 [Homalodisca vitripennis]
MSRHKLCPSNLLRGSWVMSNRCQELGCSATDNCRSSVDAVHNKWLRYPFRQQRISGEFVALEVKVDSRGKAEWYSGVEGEEKLFSSVSLPTSLQLMTPKRRRTAHIHTPSTVQSEGRRYSFREVLTGNKVHIAPENIPKSRSRRMRFRNYEFAY